MRIVARSVGWATSERRNVGIDVVGRAADSQTAVIQSQLKMAHVFLCGAFKPGVFPNLSPSCSCRPLALRPMVATI
jgi:hypothetical protein